MSVFSRLFEAWKSSDAEGLLPAIERAVAGVEPLLTQVSGYPSAYRKSVSAALEYARTLAAQVPGPIEVSREAYVGNALVHAIFPSAQSISEALGTSQCMREYLSETPEAKELYALMGMRRMEKNTFGMELSAEQLLQRDVPQQVVYFISHTLDSPALTEAQARDRMAMEFFDKLVGKVAARVEKRKKRKQRQMEEKDKLMAQLRVAGAGEKAVLQQKIDSCLRRLQALNSALDLSNYVRDFEVVLLNAERHLYMVQTSIVMDSMGIRRSGDDEGAGELVFYDLLGFDRRRWTVIMVHFSDLHAESFADMLEKAYRGLVFEWLVK